MTKEMVTKFLSLTVPINDNFLYCEECNEEYEGDCPTHGPLIIVSDAEVPASCSRGCDLGYSRATLPEGLIIKKSRIPKAGLGVFALKDFPARCRFGPFQGREETNEEIVQESGYCWQILRDGIHSHYLDAKKPSESNWMRFVNCSRSEDEQCMTAYQYKGEIYYRSHRHIFAGNEILVYYGDSYAKELGLRIQRVGSLSRKTPNVMDPDKAHKVEDGYNMHFCPPCYTAFSKLDDLQKHIKKMTEEKLADVVNGQKKATDASETTAHTPDWNSLSNKVVCAFQKNSKLHVNEKGCKVCKSSQSSSRDPAYNCDVCGAEFSSSGYLQTHRGVTGEKPYKCNICDLSFLRIGNLETHKRKHAGESSYKCDVCSAQFADKSMLMKHKTKHTGEKPYKCNVCNEQFVESADLLRHKSKHSGERPYKCDTCGLGFAQNSHLQMHARMHVREKPYKCDVCGAGFAHNGNLQAHKRTHTGEKPYKCDVCGAEFTHCGGLQAHRRTHK